MRTELLILILAGFPPLAGNRNRNHTHKSLSEVGEVIAKQKKKEKENRYDCTLFFISDKLSDKFFFCVAVNKRRKQK